MRPGWALCAVVVAAVLVPAGCTRNIPQDKATGKEQSIQITASSGLSKDEVDKMQKDAESHAADDAKRREEVETKNTADTMAYTAEKTMREQKDKIPAELNTELEEQVKELRKMQLAEGDEAP